MAEIDSTKYFQPIDFIIFAGMFATSTAIGIYFAYKDRGMKSTENYYFGSRKISPIPVSISLGVSFISAITVIGTPAEVYLYGMVFAWLIVGQILSIVIAAVYYIPLYYRLQLKSVYEYLSLRFCPEVRSTASVATMVNMVLYMGVTVYIPSLALSAVTPLNLTWTIALTSVICTFYTCIGGIKAVIWTDVFQALIMIAGMLAVFIQSVIVLGGFDEIVAAAERGGRNNFLKFETDPRIRSTAWSFTMGSGVNYIFRACCNQVNIQRYLSCDSIRSARIAAFLKMIPTSIFSLISVANGLAMYAYFEGCDPVEAGDIVKIDQGMPVLALRIFQSAPGMAGLFVSAAYSGTLSTISSGINSLSAMVLEDFVVKCKPETSQRNKVFMSQVLTVVFGIVVMGLAYFISVLESNVFVITTSINGCIGGPILAVFTMGIFMPWMGSTGALLGMITGWLCSGVVAVAAQVVDLYPPGRAKLPVSVDNCTSPYFTTPSATTFSFNESTTHFTMTSMSHDNSTSYEEIEPSNVLNYTILSISPFYYGLLGLLTAIITGHLFCIFTGFDNPSKANPDLFVPIINIKAFRFCVPERGDASDLKKETEALPEELEMLNKQI